nr:alpha/beta hydrolase [Agrobacterium tumefaciens]
MDNSMLRLHPGLSVEIARWGSLLPIPQIVLLHEGLGSVSTWKDFPARLAQETGVGVVAYSREGYGRSSPLMDLGNPGYLEEEAKRLASVLDALEIDKAYLLGHSDGGTISLLAAAFHPDRISAVLVEAPHLYVEPETVAAVRAVGLSWENGPLRAALARHHQRPEPIFRRWHDLWTSGSFAESLDIREILPHIRCPLIAVQGAEDRFASSRQLADIEHLVPSANTIWLDGCGHEPHRTHPEAILALAKTLLDL